MFEDAKAVEHFFSVYSSDIVRSHMMDLYQHQAYRKKINFLVGIPNEDELVPSRLIFLKSKLFSCMFQDNMIISIFNNDITQNYFMPKYAMILDIPGLIVIQQENYHCLVSFPHRISILAKLTNSVTTQITLLSSLFKKIRYEYMDEWNRSNPSTLAARIVLLTDHLNVLETRHKDIDSVIASIR